MPQTMIERVARGIACDHYMRRFKLPADSQLVIDNVQGNWMIWSNEAKAAIAAMREPTKEMLEVGPGEPYMDDYVWAKMIDAALEEK